VGSDTGDGHALLQGQYLSASGGLIGKSQAIQEIRERIVPLAEGNVIEIGIGPGVNFVHYDPEKVNKVYALEPNPGMLQRAEEQRRKTKLDVEFLGLPGENIPLPVAHVRKYGGESGILAGPLLQRAYAQLDAANRRTYR
jgi:hypothetical protein